MCVLHAHPAFSLSLSLSLPLSPPLSVSLPLSIDAICIYIFIFIYLYIDMCISDVMFWLMYFCICIYIYTLIDTWIHHTYTGTIHSATLSLRSCRRSYMRVLVIKWMNGWMRCVWETVCVCVCVCARAPAGACIGIWINEWMKEWMNELCVSNRVCLCVKMYIHGHRSAATHMLAAYTHGHPLVHLYLHYNFFAECSHANKTR